MADEEAAMPKAKTRNGSTCRGRSEGCGNGNGFNRRGEIGEASTQRDHAGSRNDKDNGSSNDRAETAVLSMRRAMH